MIRLFSNNRLMLYVILLNTLTIFVCGFWREHIWVDVADSAFTILFLVEAITKVNAWGWKTYWQDGWNKLDLFVLLIALPSLADAFLDIQMTSNVLLTLRTLRIFKSFRLFRHIPYVKQLMTNAVAALRTSYLVCVAFILFLVIFATLSSALFGTIAPDHFGNPGLSLYSTFRLFTIEGWYELPDTISKHGGAAISVFARIYFAILLFLGGIIGMSLINSIFVDAMAANNNDEVLRKLNEIEKRLQALDDKKDTNQGS